MICEDKIRSVTAARTAARLAPLALAVLFIGCSYGPTPPSNVPPTGPQVVRGTVYPGGTTTVWVQSAHEGTFNIAMTEENPAGVPLSLEFGGPTGAEAKCETERPANMVAGGAPRAEEAPAGGLYCINVSDTGTVTQKNGVDFTLTVTLK